MDCVVVDTVEASSLIPGDLMASDDGGGVTLVTHVTDMGDSIVVDGLDQMDDSVSTCFDPFARVEVVLWAA